MSEAPDTKQSTERVTISRKAFDLLNEAFSHRMGFDEEMAAQFTADVLAGDELKVSQKTADKLVAMAQQRGGPGFANLVGRHFNPAKETAFGGRTFQQVAEGVARPITPSR